MNTKIEMEETTMARSKLFYTIGYNYPYDRHNISELLYEATELVARESRILYRMARKAQEHGCTDVFVEEIREEARFLNDHQHMPSFLFDPFCSFHFAFWCNNSNGHGRRINDRPWYEED